MFIIKRTRLQLHSRVNPPKVNSIKVSNFVTANSTESNKILTLFVDKISPESDLNSLTKIKYVLHQAAVWGKIMKKDPIMCACCQRAGHTAVNCNLDYRCAKCTDEHEPENCTIKKNENIDLKK